MNDLTAEDVAYIMHNPLNQHVIEIGDGEFAVVNDVLIHKEEGSRRMDSHSDVEFYGSSHAEYRVYCVCIECEGTGVHVTQDYRINSAQDALIQINLIDEYGEA